MMRRSGILLLIVLLPAASYAQVRDPDVLIRALADTDTSPTDDHRNPDLYRAFVLNHNGDTAADARALLEAVVRNHPRLREAWFGLGFLGLVTGDLALAENAANRALEVSPDWGLGLNLLGAVCLEQGKLGDAERWFVASFRADPTLPFPYLNLFRMAVLTDRCSLVTDAASTGLSTATAETLPDVVDAVGQAAWNSLATLEEQGATLAAATCLRNLTSFVDDPALQAGALAVLASVGTDVPALVRDFAPIVEAARASGDAALLHEVLLRKCEVLDSAGLNADAAACHEERLSAALASGDAWEAYGAVLSACSIADSTTASGNCACTIRLSLPLEKAGGVASALASMARGDCMNRRGDTPSAKKHWKLARKRFLGLLATSDDGRVPSFLGDIEEGLGLDDDAVRSRRMAIERFMANPDIDPGRIYLEREILLTHLGKLKRFPEALVEARLMVADYERLEGRVISSYGSKVMLLAHPGTCSDAALEVDALNLRMLAVDGEPLDVAEAHIQMVACLRVMGRDEDAEKAIREAQAAFSIVPVDWNQLQYAEVACDVAHLSQNYAAAETACTHFLDLARRHGKPFNVASAISRLADVAENKGDMETWERLSIKAADRFQAAGGGNISGSIWVSVSLRRMRRGDYSGALEAAHRALGYDLDTSSTMRAGLIEAQALGALGNWPESRKRFEELMTAAGHDPALWDQILGTAGAMTEVEIKQLVIRRFKTVQDLIHFPPELALTTQVQCIALEAHATGKFAEGLEKLKVLFTGLEPDIVLPETVLLTATGLALAAGDVPMTRALSAMLCARDSDQSVCTSDRMAPQLLSSAILGSERMAVMVRQGHNPSRGELMEMAREELLPAMGIEWSNESADAILADKTQTPVQARYRASLHLIWTQPDRALGLVDEALMLLPADAPISTRLPLVIQAGSALANMERREDAIARFKEAERLARNQKDAPLRSRDMIAVASATVQAGICDEFLSLRQDIISEYQGERVGWAWISFRMDDMRCRLDDKAPLEPQILDANLAEFENMAPQLNAMGLVAMDVLMRLMFALRYHASGRIDEAIDLLRKAVEGVEHASTTAIDPAEHARMFQGFGRVPFDFAIILLLERGAPGDAEEALRLSERTRAIELLNELGRKGIQIASTSLPRDVLDRQEGLMGRLTLARTERARLGLELPWEDQRLTVADKRVVEIETDLSSFAEEVWQNHPLYASVRFPRPLDLARIPLNRDELLIEYRLLPGNQFVIWLVDVDETTAQPRVSRSIKTEISPKVLDEVRRVKEWQSAPRRNQRDALRPLTGADELTRLLLGDLLKYADPLRHRRILVVTDDDFTGISLEVLDLGNLGGCEIGGGQQGNYISDCFSIEYQPSIATFSVARNLLPTKENKGLLLALADPVFSTVDPRLDGKGPQDGTGVGTSGDPARLPSTGILAEDARMRLCPDGSRTSQCRVLVGTDAVEDVWVRFAMEGYRVLHMSTHTGTVGNATNHGGTADQDETALLLSLAVPGDTDNRLTRSEIMSLDLVGTELAVLAGCESASGNDTLSEGVAGLAAAFLRAGTRQVIGSLWPVDELATTALMGAFYSEFADTGDAAESLAQARRTVRSDPRWDAPFFWAGFVLFGPSPNRPSR
ncbi:CHAT domain-containing protein [Myxococcota bacterium]|nr:CHAT domain-containing protein [Myxococcota bacterium]